MLTVHILTRNNAATLPACLESLAPLGAGVVVADLGSTDGTKDVAAAAGAAVVDVPWAGDYSAARNAVVDAAATDWQMWVEPWERLRSGADDVLAAVRAGGPAYNLYHLQGEVIAKSCRLWRKSAGLRFRRPVYEALEPDGDRPLVPAVVAGAGSRGLAETAGLVEAWAEADPHASDVEYYRACTYLAGGRYDQFLTHANTFLFRAGGAADAAVLMTSYYAAMVLLHVKKRPAEAVQYVLSCLAEQPTLAEFWCLLGDAFAQMKQWHRAVGFYDNAVVFGGRRRHDDPYPIEIAKYKEYPEMMLSRCRELIKRVHGVNTA